MFRTGLFRLPFALALICVPLVGAPAAYAQPFPAEAAPSPGPMTDGYVLGVGDVIDVVVLGRDEYKPRVEVQADGTIQLPFLNSIRAADKTVLQLRDAVQTALKSGGYYSDPAVSVMVVNYASRYAIVLGEVGKAGLIPLERSLRVSEVLARVGGARVEGADVITLTRATGESKTMTVREIATGVGEADPYVYAGDKIYVAPPKTFYIYGQVRQPGSYNVDHEMTIRKALARGGGLTPLGSEGRIKVYRNGQDIRLSPSAPILEGDVVVVGERFF